MRKLIYILCILTFSSTVFAQSIDRNRDGWRDRDRDRYRRADTTFEFTPFGGYTWGGTLYGDTTGFRDDFDVASSGNFGAILGIPLGFNDVKLELMANRQNTHLQLGGGLFDPNDRVSDFGVSYYQAGLQIPIARSYGAVPFIVLTAGVANLDINQPGLSQETRFAGSAGVGVKVPVNRNVGFRVEARGFFTSLDDDRGDNCFRCNSDFGRDLYQGETNVGLVISF